MAPLLAIARRALTVALPALVVSRSAPLSAQGRRTVDNAHSWYSYFGEHSLGGRWSLWTDVHVRREGLGATWQQLLIRPGLTYRLNDRARLGAGYGYIVTHQYGDDPIPARFPEHRVWQQLVLTHDAGRVQFAQRYRMEQRWLGVMDTSARPRGGDDRVRDWRRLSRVRYQLRATLPLRTGPVGPYATAFNEAFVAVGRSGRANVFDQNRAFAGLGWRFTARWRAEAGFMQQLIIRADGRSAEDNRTLAVSVFSTTPLLR